LDNIRMAPDVAFNLKESFDTFKEKSVGLSIIDLKHREGLRKYTTVYIEKFSEIAKNYISLGYEVKLFSFCEKEGDIRAICTLLNNLEPSYRQKINVIKYTTGIYDFLKKFKA